MMSDQIPPVADDTGDWLRLVTVLVLLSFAVVLASPVFAAGTTDVSLTPRNVTVPSGGTATVDVVVEDADGGVGAMNLTVSVEGNATFVGNVEIHGNPGTDEVVRRDGNRSVTLSAAIMDTDDEGSVTVATVTLHGVRTGYGGLSLTVWSLADETGSDYTVGDTRDATVLVAAPAVVGNKSVTDPDGDGRYEDVNGDGAFTALDVQVFEEEVQSAVVQNNPRLFDFNADGVVNRADVQALKAEGGFETATPTDTETPPPTATPTDSPTATPTTTPASGTTASDRTTAAPTTTTTEPPGDGTAVPATTTVSGSPTGEGTASADAVGTDAGERRQRGFFTNDGGSTPLANALNLTLLGFVLSVVGIVHQMLKGR